MTKINRKLSLVLATFWHLPCRQFRPRRADVVVFDVNAALANLRR